MGPVGPIMVGLGAPAAQLMPMRMREMPMMAMMLPVTTGGNSGSIQLMSGRHQDAEDARGDDRAEDALDADGGIARP